MRSLVILLVVLFGFNPLGWSADKKTAAQKAEEKKREEERKKARDEAQKEVEKNRGKKVEIKKPKLTPDGFIQTPEDNSKDRGTKKISYPDIRNILDDFRGLVLAPDGTFWYARQGNGQDVRNRAGAIVIGGYKDNSLIPEVEVCKTEMDRVFPQFGPVLGPDNTLYIFVRNLGKGGADVKAIDLTTKKIKWSFDYQKAGGGTQQIYGRPFISLEGNLVIPADALIVLGPDGKEKWHWQGGCETFNWTTVQAKDGTIYSHWGSHNGGPQRMEVVAFKPDGTIKWRLPTNKPRYGMPMAINKDGIIYTPTSPTELSGITPDGKISWTVPYEDSNALPYRDMGITEDGTIFISGKKTVVMDKDTHLKKHEFFTAGDDQFYTILDGDRALFAGSLGMNQTLYILSKDGVYETRFKLGEICRNPVKGAEKFGKPNLDPQTVGSLQDYRWTPGGVLIGSSNEGVFGIDTGMPLKTSTTAQWATAYQRVQK